MAGMTSLLGCGTREGVTGGAERLLAAALDRIAADIQGDSDAAVSFISSGGDAERLLPLLTTKVQYEPQLVLQGLAIMSDTED
jgi:type III pantothenate kinase